jgi:hypothetical protein
MKIVSLSGWVVVKAHAVDRNGATWGEGAVLVTMIALAVGNHLAFVALAFGPRQNLFAPSG